MRFQMSAVSLPGEVPITVENSFMLPRITHGNVKPQYAYVEGASIHSKAVQIFIQVFTSATLPKETHTSLCSMKDHTGYYSTIDENGKDGHYFSLPHVAYSKIESLTATSISLIQKYENNTKTVSILTKFYARALTQNEYVSINTHLEALEDANAELIRKQGEEELEKTQKTLKSNGHANRRHYIQAGNNQSQINQHGCSCVIL